MAFITCNFFSEVLGISTAMNVILPESTKGQIGMTAESFGLKHPTLYLLHGLSDDHTIWMRRTSIERYAAPLGLAVVMPAANRSYYTDMACGHKYWTFISEELPHIARGFFHLSDAREDNFVAGLSMGGYGAFKLVLRHPDKFAAAASLSGALDISARVKRNDDDLWQYGELKNIFGDLDNIKGTENELFYLAEQVMGAASPRPLLYQCCGIQDLCYEDNLRFKKHCEKIGLEVTYKEGEGTHEWGFWDQAIQEVLKWLPIQSN